MIIDFFDWGLFLIGVGEGGGGGGEEPGGGEPDDDQG